MTSFVRGRIKHLPIVGWREWVGLPDLGVKAIKAKVDTGARSSSLHAFEVEEFTHRGGLWVRFTMHPLQRSERRSVTAEAPVDDRRRVRNSGGQIEERLVIVTNVSLGLSQWPIELTLTNRDEMGFRMLLGREALRGRLLVHPGSSYLLGKRPRRKKKVKRGSR